MHMEPTAVRFSIEKSKRDMQYAFAKLKARAPERACLLVPLLQSYYSFCSWYYHCYLLLCSSSSATTAAAAAVAATA